MTKVIDISQAKKKDAGKEEQKENQEVSDFADIIEKNKKNKERVEKERAKDNKSVLRSYRIKT